MKTKVYLVYLNNQPFLMVNALEPLLVKQCNSTVTKTWNVTEADHGRDVFELFGINKEVLPEPFDRRTSGFKSWEKTVKYFNVGMLQTLSELTK